MGKPCREDTEGVADEAGVEKKMCGRVRMSRFWSVIRRRKLGMLRTASGPALKTSGRDVKQGLPPNREEHYTIRSDCQGGEVART